MDNAAPNVQLVRGIKQTKTAYAVVSYGFIILSMSGTDI